MTDDKSAVGTARGDCEDPMEVWNVVETALHDLTDCEGYGDESYPADVEVEIRVE